MSFAIIYAVIFESLPDFLNHGESRKFIRSRFEFKIRIYYIVELFFLPVWLKLVGGCA